MENKEQNKKTNTIANKFRIRENLRELREFKLSFSNREPENFTLFIM